MVTKKGDRLATESEIETLTEYKKEVKTLESAHFVARHIRSLLILM